MEELELKFKKIETLVGYELPQYFKQFYTKYSGGKIHNIEFLTLDEIINEISNLDSETEAEDLEEDLQVDPKGSIKKKIYTRERLPFITDYSGDFIGIDFNPGSKGIIGQVINYGCDDFTMYVFANTFKDFIEGIFSFENYDEEIYLTDFLIDNQLHFRNDVLEEDIPKKIAKPRLKKITIEEEKVTEYEKNILFRQEILSQVIDILETLNSDLKKNINIIKKVRIFEDYRIKNHRDSLSRTMGSKESFWTIHQTYPKEEIKGYSFTLKLDLEEAYLEESTKKSGLESIFIDIDMNKVLIRYRATIENKQYQDAYTKLCDLFNTIAQ